MLSVASWIAIAIIAAALILAWTRRFLAVGALAVSNVLVHILKEFGGRSPDACTGSPFTRSNIHNELALCADRLYAGEPIAFLQLFTSMWVHADLVHLVSNMFILLALALVFEDLVGPRRLVTIYLVTGLIAAFSQIAVRYPDPMLLMGASGAVAGVAGAFGGAYPHMVMRLPIPAPIIFFVRMRVITWVILFALMQIALQALSLYTQALGGVAYAAHLGGLAAGLGLGYYWIKAVQRKKEGPQVKVDLEDLERFARDSSTRRAYDEMKANRDLPDVFSAWFDRFWEGARDPETGQRVRPGPRGTVIREDGESLTIRR